MVLILFVISHRFNLKKTPKNTQEYGISSPVWGHSLSTYEKFSTEPRFLNPVSFSENFAYVLNEWSFHQLNHVHKWQSILMIWFHFIGYSEQWQLRGGSQIDFFMKVFFLGVSGILTWRLSNNCISLISAKLYYNRNFNVW